MTDVQQVSQQVVNCHILWPTAATLNNYAFVNFGVKVKIVNMCSWITC